MAYAVSMATFYCQAKVTKLSLSMHGHLLDAIIVASTESHLINQASFDLCNNSRMEFQKGMRCSA